MSNQVFLAYSRQDQDVIDRFSERFEKRTSFILWRADRELRPGEPFEQITKTAIFNSVGMILCMTPSIQGKSGIIIETKQALEKSQEDRAFSLLSIRLKYGGILPKEFGRRVNINFAKTSNWDPLIARLEYLLERKAL